MKCLRNINKALKKKIRQTRNWLKSRYLVELKGKVLGKRVLVQRLIKYKGLKKCIYDYLDAK